MGRLLNLPIPKNTKEKILKEPMNEKQTKDETKTYKRKNKNT